MEKTLIVTLLLNEEADEYFTNLRNQHFPAAINYLRAHLTLFHKLPDEDYVYQTIEWRLLPFVPLATELPSKWRAQL
jgi:hypothetical protein